MNLANIDFLHEIGEKKNQEDYIWPLPGTANLKSSTFIVCDGVGGSDNGEVASRFVAETLGKILENVNEKDLTKSYMDRLVRETKSKLSEYAEANGFNKDMATTFALLVLLPGNAMISWCGDSRVYHIRDGKILFHTEDHSLVNNLVRNGEISAAEAKRYPGGNIILKAIKADDTPAEADFHWINSIESRDYFLLCSDGLLENVSDKDIESLLTNSSVKNGNISSALLQKCKDRTRDNYSMYLLQVDGVNQQQQKASSRKIKRVSIAVVLIAIIAVAGFFLVQNRGTNKIPVVSDSLSQNDKVNRNSSPGGANTQLIADTMAAIELVNIPDSTDESLSTSAEAKIAGASYNADTIKGNKRSKNTGDSTGAKSSNH